MQAKALMKINVNSPKVGIAPNLEGIWKEDTKEGRKNKTCLEQASRPTSMSVPLDTGANEKSQ